MAEGSEQNGLDVPVLHEHLLGEAFEHGPLGVIVFDESGNFLAANRRAAEVSGFGRGELLELGSFGLCRGPEVGDRLREVVSGERTDGCADLHCKDGTVKEVTYRLGPTRVSGLPFFVGVFWES